MEFVRSWDHGDSPVLWVEMLYVGDTQYMLKFLGFSYGGHRLVSVNQTTTFYKNKKTEEQAKQFGRQKFLDLDFVNWYCKKTEEVEQHLIKTARLLEKLPEKTNAELGGIFEQMFRAYAVLMAFYRFCRRDFYDAAIGELHERMPEPKDEHLRSLFEGKNDDPQLRAIGNGLQKVGKRRLEMHVTWQGVYTKMFPLFEELGKRLGMNGLETQNCTRKEILDGLKGKKLDIMEIRRRVKHFTFTYREGLFNLLSNAYHEPTKQGTEVRGTVAYPGKVRGKATIIKESLSEKLAEHMAKMEEGTILITVMTSPDMIPAIRKATAIVTDGGGILCHSAIIAREMKIPGIIGTKNATHIFKSGDFIEVDANEGIVRKIS